MSSSRAQLDSRLSTRVAAMLVVGALVAAGLVAAQPSGASSGLRTLRHVPVPTVTGPIGGGIRTGMPQASPIYDLLPHQYIEKEYFISGTATAVALKGMGGYTFGPQPGSTPPPAGSTAPYKTRIDVILPPAGKFNGWVAAEWANVTLQFDDMYSSYQLHDYLMREGWGMAFISAQKAGVDGQPTSLTNYDPVRYGSLHHPGDAYAYDIYSQAVAALRSGSKLKVDPMGGLRVQHVVATGSSQSCGTLKNYDNTLAGKDGVVDGVLAHICGADGWVAGSKQVIPADAPPTMWVNSESESGTKPESDAQNFRVWEVAGSSHVENYSITQVAATHARDDSSFGGSPSPGIGWNANAERQYGERASRPCSNLFPMHYNTIAALAALKNWIQTGHAPVSVQFKRDAAGAIVRDGDGNIEGGVRLPPIDVPVAQYAGTDCGPLDGSTYTFAASKLAKLYPTHQDYVCKMAAATQRALKVGWMLEPEASEMISLAEAAPIPSAAAAMISSAKCAAVIAIGRSGGGTPGAQPHNGGGGAGAGSRATAPQGALPATGLPMSVPFASLGLLAAATILARRRRTHPR